MLLGTPNKWPTETFLDTCFNLRNAGNRRRIQLLMRKYRRYLRDCLDWQLVRGLSGGCKERTLSHWWCACTGSADKVATFTPAKVWKQTAIT